MLPQTRYARSGDCSIAYQVLGSGLLDLVYVPGFVSNVELGWRVPDLAEYLRAIASFSRLILFDKRGTGMSDRIAGAPSLETRMDDVRAVMESAGSSRAALMGTSEGGALSVLFAATYPDRISALVLLSTSPRPLWAPDYPFGEREEDYDRWTNDTVERWGTEEWVDQMISALSPGYDEASRRAAVDYYRQSASPGAVLALETMNKQIDVRPVLQAVRVPTLVISLTGDSPSVVNGSRYMAERIPGARLVELPGRGHVPTRENMEPILDEIKRFLADAQNDGWEEIDRNRVARNVDVHGHRGFDRACVEARRRTVA
jgi:pimeloyl-ACP methyl ester carboxylesterase